MECPTCGTSNYGDILCLLDILRSVNEMDSSGFYKATGSTSSWVPAGSCCRPLMRFARQAISVCPTVMSHCFSRQFLVLNDIDYKISLFHLKIFYALISRTFLFTHHTNYLSLSITSSPNKTPMSLICCLRLPRVAQ